MNVAPAKTRATPQTKEAINASIEQKLASFGNLVERCSLMGSVWNFFARHRGSSQQVTALYDNSAKTVHEFLCQVVAGDAKAVADCATLEKLGEQGLRLQAWRCIYTLTK